MKTITKSECLALIERLGGKSEFEACLCTCKDGESCRGYTQEKQIEIGDVLDKLGNKLTNNIYDNIRLYWEPCGFSKSLQEILEGAEECWLCDECGELIVSDDGGCENEPRCYGNDNAYIEAIIGKEAELFLFLNKIL